MNRRAFVLNTTGKRENPLSLLLNIVLAMSAAFALSLDMNVRSGNLYVNWAESLPGTPVVTVLFAALLIVMHRADRRLPKAGAGVWLLSLFLGLWWVLVVSVRNTGDVNQPFLSNGQLIKTGAMTLGMAALYQLLFRALVFALDSGRAWKMDMACAGSLVRRAAEAYRRHTVLLCAAVILLAWLPHFLISYPCAMNSDAASQLREWTGLSTFSSHHPPFGTMLIGRFYEAGVMLGDGATGLALYVAAQMLACAAVLGRAQQVMRELGAPLWLRLLALFAACVCPVYADNITTIIKDVPYAYGLLLVLCETADCLFIRERPTAAGLLRLLAGGMFVMLMRNNGKFVLLPLAVCLIIRAVSRPGVRAAALCMAAAIALSLGVQSWMMSAYDIVPGSRAEALSLPFQQTARFVREHEAEIPQDEYDAIEAVLGMSGLGKIYDPVISDPVKTRFRKDVTDEDMQRYFAVWLEQFHRDPACYVKATLIQNILLLDPQTKNLAIFDGTGLGDETREKLGVTETDARDELRRKENDLRMTIMSLPGMAQLNSLGFHCCLMLFACLWAARKKQGRLLMILLPLLMSMLVIIAGPCIQNQDRYGFPIVYCMPLALACMSHAMHKQTGAAGKAL